ncbi:MAG: SCO family protein [Bdellovibrionaceae bacterium]|nr:SCO family protein [Pseudobdellovibrionaceae bacterium]MDW8190947.1 SCO family protein [Pseudobdellovibrionaceae bacterium]
MLVPLNWRRLLEQLSKSNGRKVDLVLFSHIKYLSILSALLLGWGGGLLQAKPSQILSSHLQKPSSELPGELKQVGIDEQLGSSVDLSIQFTDENGRTVSLAEYFDGTIPVMLSLVYFNCPGLCNLHLNGVVDALKGLSWSIGREFRYLAVSFDSRENWQLAQAQKNNYLSVYDRNSSSKDWHFLTGSTSAIERLTRSLGFRFRWDEKNKEWAHASALIFLSPTGVITRYLHGVVFEANQIKLALSEAANGTIGTLADKFVWFCYKYDPQQSKYVVYAFRLVQIGGGLMVLLLAIMLLPTWRREL